MLVDNTPVEHHDCGSLPVIVKREDLCCPFPGPSFSKMRGVMKHIADRPETTIGVLDTFHSKAGWAVAYACHYLGKQAVDFWPLYKADGQPLPVMSAADWPPREQQRQARDLGALMHSLPAGRSAILYHRAKKIMSDYTDSYVMPNALKLPESITENAAEARRTIEDGKLPAHGTLVISISSGTVAAGVLKGFKDAGWWGRHDVILHMGYSRSEEATRRYIEKVSGAKLSSRVRVIDEGYSYKDKAKPTGCPFPINPYYDEKAWAWLQRNGKQFEGQPVIFWSIGD